ncbi:MAG: aminopeptidase [Actinomycetota bacterium]|nr:aminopeptidase [Actinomycetota bacterium]
MVEDSAEGEIAFEYPAVRGGFVVEGIRLRFEGGRVVDASASAGDDYLFSTLDTDEGARRLGELGVGCNPAIQQFIRNTLFDEKIEGTVHLALGRGFEKLGGTNESAVHWEMVKEMRKDGQLSCDGEVVQRDGRWLI